MAWASVLYTSVQLYPWPTQTEYIEKNALSKKRSQHPILQLVRVQISLFFRSSWCKTAKARQGIEAILYPKHQRRPLTFLQYKSFFHGPTIVSHRQLHSQQWAKGSRVNQIQEPKKGNLYIQKVPPPFFHKCSCNFSNKTKDQNMKFLKSLPW